MSELKIPGPQYVARDCYNDASKTQKALLLFDKNRPTFRYSPIDSLLRDILRFRLPLDSVLNGLKKVEKRAVVLNNFLEIATLAHQDLIKFEVQQLFEIEDQRFPIGQGLSIPLKNLFLIHACNKSTIIFPIFWKSNPLTDNQFSILATIIRETLDQNPDFQDVEVIFYDFGAISKSTPRTLTKSPMSEIELLAPRELTKALQFYVEGFHAASNLIGRKPVEKQDHSRADTETLDLFRSNRN